MSVSKLDTGWFKSSYSAGANDQCVECRFVPGEGVYVRDTKHREVPPIRCDFEQWKAFLESL